MMAKTKTKKNDKIITATIVNNLPYCGKCGTLLDRGTIDYKEVEHRGEKYVEFIKYCSNPNCDCKNVYYAQITMDATNRYSFSDDEIIEIEEEELAALMLDLEKIEEDSLNDTDY